jgi:hypothetical protein
MEDDECTHRSLQLVICEPVRLREIDEDYFEDSMPDDGGKLSDDLLAALEKINEIIRNHEPTSWEPGKYAAFIPRF